MDGQTMHRAGFSRPAAFPKNGFLETRRWKEDYDKPKLAAAGNDAIESGDGSKQIRRNHRFQKAVWKSRLTSLRTQSVDLGRIRQIMASLSEGVILIGETDDILWANDTALRPHEGESSTGSGGDGE